MRKPRGQSGVGRLLARVGAPRALRRQQPVRADDPAPAGIGHHQVLAQVVEFVAIVGTHLRAPLLAEDPVTQRQRLVEGRRVLDEVDHQVAGAGQHGRRARRRGEDGGGHDG